MEKLKRWVNVFILIGCTLAGYLVYHFLTGDGWSIGIGIGVGAVWILVKTFVRNKP